MQNWRISTHWKYSFVYQLWWHGQEANHLILWVFMVVLLLFFYNLIETFKQSTNLKKNVHSTQRKFTVSLGTTIFIVQIQSLLSTNRPFYSCLLSCQAFDLEWGWRWPCCDRDQNLVSMITNNLHLKSSKVCIITRSPLASFLFKGLATKHTTVKWTIDHTIYFLVVMFCFSPWRPWYSCKIVKEIMTIC